MRGKKALILPCHLFSGIVYAIHYGGVRVKKTNKKPAIWLVALNQLYYAPKRLWLTHGWLQLHLCTPSWFSGPLYSALQKSKPFYLVAKRNIPASRLPSPASIPQFHLLRTLTVLTKLTPLEELLLQAFWSWRSGSLPSPLILTKLL